MKKKMKAVGGFTLAELLIVVAIIAVLAAIAIPVFSAQLNKSKYQTDYANARSIYSELSADYLARAGKNPPPVVAVSPSAASAVTDAVTLTISGEKEVFEFSGLSKITINAGDPDTKPGVKIEPKETGKYGDAKTFGTVN